MEPTDVVFTLTRAQTDRIIMALERFNARMEQIFPKSNENGPGDTGLLEERKNKMISRLIQHFGMGVKVKETLTPTNRRNKQQGKKTDARAGLNQIYAKRATI